MSNKIESYVNALFTDVPRTKKAVDLREELISNMNERFSDYLSEGKSETQAYSITIASMGDLDAMIQEVMPDDKFREAAQQYRKRNAKFTAIAIALYILSIAVVVGCSEFGDEAFGLIWFLVICAVATALLVYTHMSTPLEFKNIDSDARRELRQRVRRIPEKGRTLAYSLIYWLAIICLYLSISFLASAWSVTWLIWIFAALLYAIIYVVYMLRGEE